MNWVDSLRTANGIQSKMFHAVKPKNIAPFRDIIWQG